MDILPARVRITRRSGINIRNSVKIRVGHWFTNLWEDMRRKSPVAVQHWVDSLPTPIAHPSNSDPIHEGISDETNDDDVVVLHRTTEPNAADNKNTTETNIGNTKTKGSAENVSDSELLRHSTPVRIPRRGTIVREASLPSDSPQRRRLLLRDSSFQSDDAVSHCSSVDSLLESRRADPEAVLLGLGFGPSQSQTDLSRIPQRFLGPSRVRGVDTEKFLKQQQLQREMHESGVWGYRGLTGDPHSPPSHIVAKIMERIHSKDQQGQYLDSCAQDSEN